MHTDTVQIRAKKGGKRPFFSEAIEDEIAHRYLVANETSRALAAEYATKTRGGKLSEAAIRLIVKRSEKRREEREKGAA